jgi:outer membrane protein TolC
MQDDVFGDIWGKPENSYTVDVEGSIPLWDWGQRDKRIQAEELGLEQSRLRIEETTADITADILNEVRNVEEYEDRAFNMQANLGLSSEISQRSLSQYEQGEISALDLLQSLRREVDTAENFLDVYLGWRQALQRLQEITYYDWERDALLLDRFGISFADYVGGL